MLNFLTLLLKLWPVIKPILPVLLEVVKENEDLLRDHLSKSSTPKAVRDFFEDTLKERMSPYNDEWWQ